MLIKLKRGYSVEVSCDNQDAAKIIEVGNYSKSKHSGSIIVSSFGIAPTVRENHGEVTGIVEQKIRIRKLTPKECLRLMGVSDDRSDKMLSVCSQSQCYKQAGNSITVNILEMIFGQMFEGKEDFWKRWLDGRCFEVQRPEE